jgi:hypothetical protein
MTIMIIESFAKGRQKWPAADRFFVTDREGRQYAFIRLLPDLPA